MIWWPKSLRGLTILFLGLFLAATVFAGFGTFFAMLATIDSLVDKRIESESRALAPPGVATPRATLEQRIEDLGNRRDTGDLGLLLTDRHGHRLAGNAVLARQLPLGFSALDRRDQIEGLSSGRVYVRDIGGDMRLVIFAETEPIDHYCAARQRIYLIGFGSIILVVLTGLLLFRRLIGKRIMAMRQTADSIIAGDLSQRVPVHEDGGEFDQQAAAFNRMLDRICDLMAEVRNVSNTVSHELRTPLARLRNELALLENQADALSIKTRLQQARNDADDLLDMFGAMLRIAEIESGARRAGFRLCRVSVLIDEVVELMQPVAEDAGQQLNIGPCIDARLTGDPQLLSQMLLNMVENSLRHTLAGTRVTISAVMTSDRLILSVEDNGPGIAPDQQPLVMRRFGRLDRSRDKNGHGLGLPLIDAIARLHGGVVQFEDAEPGLRLSVSFPTT
ncbi:MAG TPA: HAMP domain-containing sensor histidine kinase [Sphingobium sp.]|nr:HAMP domain-containing sensor histidine kinase [Sphingobium sp.]